jgi:DNA-directed RNA polymerase specialized sigma24 family protein
LLDAARQKASARGGGNRGARVALEHPEAQRAFIDPHEVLAVGSALDALARQNELQARAFELQFFGGLEIAEISRVMGLSEKKVQRLLRVARAALAVLVGRQQAVQRDVG